MAFSAKCPPPLRQGLFPPASPGPSGEKNRAEPSSRKSSEGGKPTAPIRSLSSTWLWQEKIKRSQGGQTAGFGHQVSTSRSGDPFWNSFFFWSHGHLESNSCSDAARCWKKSSTGATSAASFSFQQHLFGCCNMDVAQISGHPFLGLLDGNKDQNLRNPSP